MRNKVLISVIALLVIGGVYAVLGKQESSEQKDESEAMMDEKDNVMMKGENETEKGEEMPASSADKMKDDKAMMDKDDAMMVKYQGTVLAGTSAPLLEYNRLDYDAALASDKLVVVYFYANWCPICVAEFPKMQEAFNELKSDKVVGFRMNYNDNETDDQEKSYAREYGVAFQHTKVFVKNGDRVLKSPESWDKARYL